MPLKKKRISELEEANDMKGFYTIGYRIVNGVKTSLKFGLEKVQTAYENMVKVKDEALAAIRDIRGLEATVGENEEVRETAESRRNASEQSRQTAETARSREEQARETAESTRVTSENTRKTAETGRTTAETARDTAEKKRATDESTRGINEQERKSSETVRDEKEKLRIIEEDKRIISEKARADNEGIRMTQEDKRKTDETGRVNAESGRVSTENIRSQSETTRTNNENTRKSAEEARVLEEGRRKTAETSRDNAESTRASSEVVRIQKEEARHTAEGTRASNESARVSAESERVTAESKRKSEYGGIIQELEQAGQSTSEQTALAKTATDNANAATQASIKQTGLAKTATDSADAAAGSVNAAKDGANAAAAGANAAKSATEAQTALAKTATDGANAAANYANQKGNLASEKAALADTAAASANNAVAGVDAKVQAAIDKLIAGAPGALDTLKELSDALGNDPNFAATISAELGKKLNRTDIINNLTSGGVDKPLSAEQGKALSTSLVNHNHDTVYERIINKLTAFNKNFGTTAGTVCQGDDARLNNARPPLAHGHPASEITTDSSHRFVTDTEKNTWNSKAEGNHNHTGAYQPAGNYASASHDHTGTYEPAFTKSTAFNKNFGGAAGTVCEGNDTRLSDSRTPKTHTHNKAEISDFPSSMPASDVPGWAKAPNKPTYSASEVGASPAGHNHTGVYQPVGEYAVAAHNHDATYQPKGSYAAGNHNHDGTYQPVGNYAPQSHGHSASEVTEELNKRFMTDAERTEISSLGTYAKKDFSNVTTQNLGQNGYCKFPNGLLLQWGYLSSSSNATYVYLPTSFYNTNYCVTITFVEYANGMNIVSPLVTLKNTSNFRMRSRYAVGDANGTGEGTNPFGWIAVGCWK